MNVVPHNRAAERAIIGSILIDPQSYALMAARLAPDDFYDSANGRIWRAAGVVSKGGKEIDSITLTDADKEISPTYLSECRSETPSSINIESYVSVVEKAALYRKMLDAALVISQVAYSQPESVDESLDRAQSAVYALTKKRGKKNAVSASGAADQVIRRLDYLATNGHDAGIPTGIADLDTILSGWQNSDLVIVAARPSVGKTAFAVGSARHAAEMYGKKVAIFSLEMSAQSIGTRLLAGLSGVPVQDILRGKVSGSSWVRLATGVAKMLRLNITIDDTPTLTPAELRSRARQIKAESGLDLILVDYLQLIVPDRMSKEANRVVEVAEISRALKALARELNVPVIALSQLSRASEHREGGEPRLADLRDSGAIEQDADIVLMLWRQSDGGVVMKVAKHRNGPTGEVKLDWRPATVEFK